MLVLWPAKCSQYVGRHVIRKLCRKKMVGLEGGFSGSSQMAGAGGRSECQALGCWWRGEHDTLQPNTPRPAFQFCSVTLAMSTIFLVFGRCICKNLFWLFHT